MENTSANDQRIPHSYEEAVARLKEIIALLETDEQSLETTLVLMAEGKVLLKYCSDQLKEAENQLEILQSAI